MNKIIRSSPATGESLTSRALFTFLLTAMLYCGLLVVARGQTSYERLKSFGFPELSGTYPRSPLVNGGDGKFYGTTFWGGTNDAGAAFKLNPDGSGYVVLHHFTWTDGDGSGPVALVEGSDGALYGTTERGGTGLCSGGTIFKLNKNGSGHAVLRSFDGCGDAIAHSPLSVMQGRDAALYGTTSTGGVPGGTNSVGAVFRLNMDGSGYTVLHLFINSNEGSDPVAIIQGSDGTLYGTSSGGDSYSAGTIFKLSRDGSGFAVLHSFTGGDGDGNYPKAGLLEGSDGALYGTTIFGGTNDGGTIFKLNKDGNGYMTLHSLSFVDDGRPKAALIEGRDGTLYGSAMGYKYLGGRLFKINKNGSGYTVLYSFPRIESDSGAQPNGLAQGNDGALYGTTQNGGSSSEGSVFTLTTEGNAYTVLHNFSTSGGDGQSPQAALVEGSEGALYGTTAGGGSNGQGTVFKLNKDGSTYRVLYSFNGSDGAGPCGRLVEGRDGALYGTTSRRGENDAGAVFKLNKDGSSYRVLHSFSGSDGAWHYGGLVEGSDGVLYGTTSGGGSAGMGTVFKLNKSGSGYSVLRSFSTNGIDGQYPVAALVEGSDGGLYGTTRYGGTHGGGTVLKLNKDGSAYSLLHSFDGFDAGPQSALLRGSDGGLYGTTPYGGNNNAGTIFKLNQDGSGYTVLLRFSTSGDSQNPIAALTEGSDGALYGTASYGGGYGGGAVFKVNKDGSLYSVLHSFNSPYDGGRPEAGLLKGSDGAFYGTTFWGGELESGTVFKLFSSTPIVAITRLQLDGVGTRLSFSGGSAGQMFRIETKTDLNAPLWQTIATNQFGIDGKSQFLDTSASNYPTRFYRSATP